MKKKLCLASSFVRFSRCFNFQFPVAENLQNIIQEQIRSLSSGPSLHSPASNSRDQKDGSKSGTQLAASQPQQPHQQQQSVVPIAVPVSAASGPTTVVAAAPTLNANAQAALMILLTAQMQSQTGEASILQNPQVVGILQNLVNQAGDPTKHCDTNVTEILNDPALSSVFRLGPTQVAPTVAAPHWQQPQQLTQQQQHPAPERFTLLETPKPTRPILLGDAPPGYAPVKSVPVSKDTSPTPPMVANNLNNLLNAQNLNQLLGSLTEAKTAQPEKSADPAKAPIRRPVGPRPVLLRDPPGLPTTSLPSNPIRSTAPGIYSFAPPVAPQTSTSYPAPPQQLPAPPTYSQPSLASVYTTMASNPPQMIPGIFSAEQQMTNYLQAAAAQHHHQQQQQQQQHQHQQQLLAANQFLLSAGFANLAATTPMLASGPPPPPQSAPQFLYSPAAQYSQQPQQTNALGYGPNSAFLANLHTYGLNGGAVSFPGGQLMAPPNALLATPPSLKRKLPIPPSPEASPEGPYIGQHSQGIGGHYADSYWRNKRAKN